jgi:hypothetical protein
MTSEHGSFWVATERVHLPPMTFDETLYWDGMGPMSQDGGPMTSSKPTLPSMHAVFSLTQAPCETQGQMATGRHARPSVTRGDRCPVRSSAPQAIDWAREAQSLTVSLDRGLFRAAARDAIRAVTGELVGVYPEGQAQCMTLAVQSRRHLGHGQRSYNSSYKFWVVMEKNNMGYPAYRAGANSSFTCCCISWRPKGCRCMGYQM